ncbi:hypothetical protein [Providencia sp. PROV266]|uniref:hypothetical protein n=1 Tax=Providencia sp. PROV266 TaxID=2949954 RepID=UPI002348F178|nr:hypothetical protein [Providencia sp. PROV266]
MNKTKLILLALNCIKENREPSQTEQSKIYVFYRTEICDKNISVDKFMLSLNTDLIEQSKQTLVANLIYKYICKSKEKKHA